MKFANKIIIILLALLALSAVFCSATEFVQLDDAEIEDVAETGAPVQQSTTVFSGPYAENTGASTPQPGTQQQTKAATIGITVAIILVALAAVLLLLIGGVIFIVSWHNSKKQGQFEAYRTVQDQTSDGDMHAIESAHNP